MIICVVVGHVINYNYIFTGALKTIIYSFHMPAFFIISGILIRKEKIDNQTFQVIVTKRMKRLLIPYVIFEIVGGLLQMFLYGTEVVNLRGILYGIVTMHCHVGANWFLPTLFFSEILFYCSAKKLTEWKLLGFGFLSFLVAFLTQDWLYGVAVIRRILIAYGFIIIGYSCKNYFAYKSKIGLAISGGVVVGLAYINGVVDLSDRIFHNPILYIGAGIVGTYFILDFSQFLCASNKFTNFFRKVGTESLIIMGTHQHVMLVTNCIAGSTYSISIQSMLLIIISIYEFIIIRFYSKIKAIIINRD